MITNPFTIHDSRFTIAGLPHNSAVADVKPPVTAELIWSEGLRFGATSGPNAIVIDGDGAAGPSPMQLAAFGLAGCMAADVVSILQKGRQPLTGLRASFSGERAPDPPRRFVRITLHFHISGAVPTDAVERAIALSREKYCSVWHSFRQDIDFSTSLRSAPVSRRGYLDWLRGVAVLIMIEAHTLDAWTRVDDRGHAAYGWAMILGGIRRADLPVPGRHRACAGGRLARAERQKRRGSGCVRAQARLADLRPRVPLPAAVVDHQRRRSRDARCSRWTSSTSWASPCWRAPCSGDSGGVAGRAACCWPARRSPRRC